MSVISFKCPNCDGELLFDPKSGKYKCEYCYSLFSQEELDAMKQDTSEKQDTSGNQDTSGETHTSEETHNSEEQGAVVYTCPSCGAQIVTDETTAATFCYYCHNPVVLGGRLEGKFLPDKIIPFSIDKKEAEKRFLEYVGSKKFIPRAFFQKKQIEALMGVYFPYWLYDTSLQGELQAEATRVRIWIAGDEEFTETKIYSVERDGQVELNNLSQNALQKANKTLAEGVLPYHFDDMKDFTMGYLSGFLAEKRDIEKDVLEQGMQQEIKGYAEHLIQESIEGYDGVVVKNCDFQVVHDKWTYVLLPVWTVTYKGRNGKMYYYSMNGQTGNVCGELPIDFKKLGLLSGIVAAAVLAIGMIGGYLL